MDLGPRKLWIRPPVSVLGRQITEAEVIRRKQALVLILRNRAPVEVIRKHRPLVKKVVRSVKLKVHCVLKVIDIEVIVEGLAFVFVSFTGSPEVADGLFSILRHYISMHDVVL